MKIQRRNIFLLALAFSITLSTGCARKAGCPAYESLHTKTTKKGELSKKKGDSQLFSKKMRKAMKRGKK